MLQIYVFFPVPQKKHIYEYRRGLFRPGNGYVCMPYGVYHRLWAHQKRQQPERRFTGCRRKKVIIELYLHVRIEIHSPHIVALTLIRTA